MAFDSLVADAASRLRHGVVVDVDVLVARLLLKCNAEEVNVGGATFGSVAAAFSRIGATLSAADAIALEIPNVVLRALRLVSEEAARAATALLPPVEKAEAAAPALNVSARDAARALLEAEAEVGSSTSTRLSPAAAAIPLSARASGRIADALGELIDELQNVDAGEGRGGSLKKELWCDS